jgi:polar amino acid transport system substrate-binding protein/arginine/ornithine transport system substrate-binding protein
MYILVSLHLSTFLEFLNPLQTMTRNRFLSILLALVAGSLTPAIAQSPDWSRIRIGVEANYPPFSQMDTDGKFSGFDIDIAAALCTAMQAQCTMVSQEWDGMLPALNARKFDMIVASMTISDERRKVVDFSDSYYDIPSTFIAKTGVFKDASPQSLQGKTIIVTRNTPRARYIAKNYKGSTVLLVAKEADVTMELAAGRGEVGFGSSLAATTAFLQSAEGKKFSKLGAPINPSGDAAGGTGIAMRKGEDALRNKVNAALKTITANGVYKKINDKYFDINIRGQ